MPFFLVRLVNGSAWDAARGRREQDGWDAHAAFMDGLVADGVILLGGPVDAKTTVHAVEAADEGAVRARFAEDPWALSGQLRIGTIRPWQIWLDGRRKTVAGET